MGGRLGWVVCVALALGCRNGPGDAGGRADTETDSGPGTESDDGTASDTGTPVDPEDLEVVGEIGMRRLSAHEFDRTLYSLLLDDTMPGSVLLPEDVLAPFDNDATTQDPSMAYVEAVEVVGREAAQRLVGDVDRRAQVVECSPGGAGDADCMETFVVQFGRRALRRTLSGGEVEDFVTLGMDVAGEAADFWSGVEVVISAMLLHPEFLYRIERGTPVDGQPGLFKLSGNEVATRLSYFLIGTTPPDWLLDAAEAGELDDADGVREVAQELIDSVDARAQVSRFHGLWLGYANAPLPANLSAKMQAESRLLLEDVVFDDPRSWLEVFIADGTYVDDELAAHYGLSVPGSDSPRWVGYGNTGRAGLLSHASFLAVGGGGAETNVVRRGKLIRNRLMCEVIPPPPPDVNVDEVPEIDGVCKEEEYELQRAVGQCAGCHAQMDPIGFGLENYDYDGTFRTNDPAMPSCEIEGEGEIKGVGTFNGPGELATLLVEEDILGWCAVTQLYRYAMGRTEDEAGANLIEELATTFSEDGQRMDEVLLDLVGHPSFGFRREEEV